MSLFCMIKIIIYKDKITYVDWDLENQDWLECEVGTEGITRHFNKIVEIKPDVTVENFVRHLEKYEQIIDLCFSSYTDGVPLRKFIEDMEKEAKTKNDISIVELIWEGDMVNEDLVIIGYLRGWLTEERIQEFGPDSDVPHDLSFVSLSAYKNCVLTLDENIVVHDFGSTMDLKKMVEEEKEVVLDGFYSWTLHDVISNFLSDISSNGSPEQRDEIASQVQSNKFDADEISKNKGQSELWKVLLETKIESLQKDKEAATEEEDYERASQLKKEIELLNTNLRDLLNAIKKHEPQR